MRRALLIAALALAAGVVSGCASEERAPARGLIAEESVTLDGADRWRDTLRAAHAEVDVALAARRFEEARALLNRTFDQSADDGRRDPEAQSGRQDLAFRLASLELDQGQTDDALEWIDRGLATPARPSPFTVNLHILAARIHELKGEADAARASRETALRLLDAPER